MNTTLGGSPYLNATLACVLDQTLAPGNLSLCGNATLFEAFRPKARLIAPGPSLPHFPWPISLFSSPERCPLGCEVDLLSCSCPRRRGMDER